MMSKTKALAIILAGVFLLGTLQVLQAQSEATEEPVVRTTSSRIYTVRKPAVRSTTTRTATSRITPARPAVAPRSASSRTTARRTPTSPMPPIPIPLPGQLKASGLLKVSCDFSILQLNDDVLGALLNSSFVLAEDAQEKFTIYVDLMAGKGDENLFRLTIVENADPEKQAEGGLEAQGQEHGDETRSGRGDKEEEFLKSSPADMISKIADRLRDILIMEFDKQRRKNREKLEEAESELKPLEDKMRRLNDLERELYAKAGMSSLRRNDVLKQIQSLERRKQDMEMRLVESAARKEALQEQIAKLGDQAKEKLNKDQVTMDLLEILKLRETELARVYEMQQKGVVSQEERAKAQEALFRARIELAQRQEAIRESTGSAMMQARVKELSDITISNAEDQAVLKHVWEQLTMFQANKILELADQYEVEIALKQDAIRQSYALAQDNIQRYRLNIQRSLAPSVSVLGGD